MYDLKELLSAGVHFGHRTSRWCPKMKPYIWGSKNKIHLIDVAKTAFLLERASRFLTEVTSKGGSILWVGTKKAAQQKIRELGERFDQPYVIHRWIGGTLSNFGQIKKAMTRYLHLQDVVKKSSPHYSKKELSSIQKEIAKLEKTIGGILNLSFPPAAVVVVDAKREQAAIKEALHLKLPIIAMVDTNTDPEGINFVIPSNDDAPRAISCIMDKLGAAVAEGTAVHSKKKAAQAAEAIKAKAEAKEKVKAAVGKAPSAKAPTTTEEAAPKAASSPKTPKVEEAPAKKESSASKTSKPAAKKTTTKASSSTTTKKESTKKKSSTTKKATETSSATKKAAASKK